MKFLLLLLICASSAMAQTQNTELVNYMLQLQYVTQSYYDSMMLTFRDARRSVSRQLVDLNAAGVTEIAEGLRTVITIRDEAQSSINATTGSDQCVQNAITAWETGLDNAGVNIASCANQTSTLLHNATQDFHHYMVEQSAVAFEVQNLILNVFTEVNPITEENRITPFVSEQVDTIYNNFNYEVVPQIFKLLEVFTAMNTTMPLELNSCVAAATERLSDEAIVLRNTLELC